MKRRIAVASALIAALFVIRATAQTLPVDRAAAPLTTASLSQAEDKLFADQVAGNVHALSGDVGDELVFTHANGMQQTKAEFLAFSGRIHFKSIVPGGRVLHVYGNVGVTHEDFTIDIGLPHTLAGIATGVYVYRGGHWQLVDWQTTDRMPPTPR